MRAATVVRGAIGAGCLLAPEVLLGAVGAPDQDDHRVQVIVRVLGARMVAQAALDLDRGRRTRGLDVVVELTHAASMLPAAAIWPAHRRTALLSAAAATTIAVLDLTGRSRRTHCR